MGRTTNYQYTAEISLFTAKVCPTDTLSYFHLDETRDTMTGESEGKKRSQSAQ